VGFVRLAPLFNRTLFAVIEKVIQQEKLRKGIALILINQAMNLTLKT